MGGGEGNVDEPAKNEQNIESTTEDGLLGGDDNIQYVDIEQEGGYLIKELDIPYGVEMDLSEGGLLHWRRGRRRLGLLRHVLLQLN